MLHSVCCAVPMIQQLESTLRAGAVPQAPQFRPSAATGSNQMAAASNNPAAASKLADGSINQSSKSKSEDVARNKTLASSSCAEEKPSSRAVSGDPLGDARSRVQEEISSEFAAIMATGTLRASEAAALATKRVMQRHGHMNAAQS